MFASELTKSRVVLVDESFCNKLDSEGWNKNKDQQYLIKTVTILWVECIIQTVSPKRSFAIKWQSVLQIDIN